jgi:hypothetical protein
MSTVTLAGKVRRSRLRSPRAQPFAVASGADHVSGAEQPGDLDRLRARLTAVALSTSTLWPASSATKWTRRPSDDAGRRGVDLFDTAAATLQQSR